MILVVTNLALSNDVSGNKIRVVTFSALDFLLPSSLQQPVGMLCKLKCAAQHEDK